MPGGQNLRPRASYTESASFSALSFASVALVTVAGSIVIARIYGVAVIGEYALTTATVTAVRLLSTSKERPALVRRLSLLEPRAPAVTGLFAAMLAFSTVLTIAVGLLAAVGSYLAFRGPIDQPQLVAPAVAGIVGYTLVGNVGENVNPVLVSFRAGRELFWIRVHEAIAFLVLAVVLGVWWGTVWGLVVAMTGAPLSALVHRAIVVRRYMRFRVGRDVVREGFGALPEMIRFGLKIVPGAIADGASNESGTWILGVVSPVATVGAWGRAWMMTRQVLTLNARIGEMLLPTLVERRARADGEGFARALIDSLRYSTAGLLLPAAAAGGAAYGIMDLFGPGFAVAADALTILLLVPVLSGLSVLMRIALYALDRPLTGSFSAAARLLVTLAAAIPLALALGPAGAALGMVLGLCTDIAYMCVVIAPRLSVAVRTFWSARQAIAIVAAYLAGAGASRAVYASLSNVLGLAAALVAGALVFVAVLVVTGGLNELDRRRIRWARTVLVRRLRVRRPRTPAATART